MIDIKSIHKNTIKTLFKVRPFLDGTHEFETLGKVPKYLVIPLPYIYYNIFILWKNCPEKNFQDSIRLFFKTLLIFQLCKVQKIAVPGQYFYCPRTVRTNCPNMLNILFQMMENGLFEKKIMTIFLTNFFQ